MIQLTYLPPDPDVLLVVGEILNIPHVWSTFPPHQVIVDQVWPDRSGHNRYWASGRLASGETVMVVVPVPYPKE